MAFPIPFPKDRSVPEKEFWDSYRRLSLNQRQFARAAIQKFLANPNSSGLERKTGGKNLYTVTFGPKGDGRAIGWYKDKDQTMHCYWVGFDHNRYMRTLDAYVRAGY